MRQHGVDSIEHRECVNTELTAGASTARALPGSPSRSRRVSCRNTRKYRGPRISLSELIWGRPAFGTSGCKETTRKVGRSRSRAGQMASPAAAVCGERRPLMEDSMRSSRLLLVGLPVLYLAGWAGCGDSI